MKQAPAPEEQQDRSEAGADAAPDGEGALRYAAPALEKGLDILEALTRLFSGCWRCASSNMRKVSV